MVCLELRASRSRKSAQNIDNQELARKILRRWDLATLGRAGECVELYFGRLVGRVSILLLVYRGGARLDVTSGVWKRKRPVPPGGTIVLWRCSANRQFPVGMRSESKRRQRTSNATVALRRPRPAQLGGNTSRREPAHAPKSAGLRVVRPVSYLLSRGKHNGFR